MSFLIENAQAAAPASQSGDPMSGMLFFIGMLALMYFLLIRPQQKRAKEHKKMVEAITKGDEVVTNGGMLGKIIEIGDQYISLEIASNIEVKLQRQAIATVLPKGSIKAAQKD